MTRSRAIRGAAAVAAAVAVVAAVGLTTLGAGASTVPAPTDPAQIIGGDPADQIYPGVASLQIIHPRTGEPDFHTCGAWQFSGYWAVTNAHCVTQPDGSVYGPEWGLHVRAGSLNRTSGGQVAQVKQIIVHPLWAWGTVPGAPVADVAMLRLDRYLDLPAGVIPAARPKTGTPTRIVGWGLTEPSGEGPTPSMLRQLDVRQLSAGRCAAGGIAVDEICLSNARNTDGACYGDSGSPSLVRAGSAWRVSGGASRQAGVAACGLEPDIYMDPVFHREWIYTVARTGASPAPAPVAVPGTDLRALSGLRWPAVL